MSLRSRLLAIPLLQEKHLDYVRAIAQNIVDWKPLLPFVESERQLINAAVRQDIKKLATHEEFNKVVTELRDFSEIGGSICWNTSPALATMNEHGIWCE